MDSLLDFLTNNVEVILTTICVVSTVISIILHVINHFYLRSDIKRKETEIYDKIKALKLDEDALVGPYNYQKELLKFIRSYELNNEVYYSIAIKKPAAKMARFLWILNHDFDDEKVKSNTIVGMMLEDKLTNSNKSSRLLLSVIAIYIASVSFNILPFNLLTLIILSVLLTALCLDQNLIIYRVRKGWYGRNEYEAREIINYVISHANKDDFNDEGGLKKLMDAPEREEHKAAEIEGWTKA